MIYTLNTQTPSFKQDEYNAHQIKINVPQEMQCFNLFVVFALPSGRKVFTPRLDLSSGSVTYPLSKGVTSEVGRVNVELQGYYNDKYIKSITYSFHVVASLTTDEDPDQSDFVPWYLEVMQKADQVETDKSSVTAMKNQIKTEETQRQVNEIQRNLDENTRKGNEIARVQTAAAAESARAQTFTTNEAGRQSTFETNEATRQTKETERQASETSRTSAETGRVNAESSRASAEQGRTTAEQGRVTAEAARVSAEQGRAAVLADITSTLTIENQEWIVV